MREILQLQNDEESFHTNDLDYQQNDLVSEQQERIESQQIEDSYQPSSTNSQKLLQVGFVNYWIHLSSYLIGLFQQCCTCDLMSQISNYHTQNLKEEIDVPYIKQEVEG